MRRVPVQLGHPIARSHELFARAVAERIDAAGLVKFSDRQRLLHLAGILGIDRTDASLLIAAVQDRPASKPASVNPACATLLCAAAIQASIVLVAWWGLLR